ncbi:hypothetical protein AB0J63_40590 [Streptosporangium canum]|uniref:hypothetical protein n=1 Tax=Streptosporangium canum TaxID=324952 RepID=UPI00343DF875
MSYDRNMRPTPHHDDGYENMTMRELRALGESQGYPDLDSPKLKADLIRQVRELDRRQAAGEPLDNVENSWFKARKSLENLKDDGKVAALRAAHDEIAALLEVPGKSSEYYAGIQDALIVLLHHEIDASGGGTPAPG